MTIRRIPVLFMRVLFAYSNLNYVKLKTANFRFPDPWKLIVRFGSNSYSSFLKDAEKSYNMRDIGTKFIYRF